MVTTESIQPIAHLCQQFGFNAQSIRHRLSLMELSNADSAILKEVHRLAIRPNVSQILDGFYDFLLGFSVMQAFLGNNEERLLRLKSSQQEYLNSFGIAFETLDYFEYRLRVGVAHERIGLPMDLYLAAYRKLEELIVACIPIQQLLPRTLSEYVRTIRKVVQLDISLAIDAYNNKRNDLLSSSLEAVERERDDLHSQLMHDSLTGALSRRFILENLNKQLAQLSRQPEHHLSIALMDLDHFKSVNDSYGHLVGDKVLYEFSRVVSNRVREQDYFGRFGGEEFLLILVGIDVEEAQSVLDRIREATQQQVFSYNNEDIPLTVSIGCTQAHPNEKVDTLIGRADSALYQAKQIGRNRVVCK